MPNTLHLLYYKEGFRTITTKLKEDFDLHSKPYNNWNGVWVPIYSAELHSANRSNIAHLQVQRVEKVLKKEKNLRLNEFVFELLNPYDYTLTTLNVYIDDKVPTTFYQYNNMINLV